MSRTALAVSDGVQRFLSFLAVEKDVGNHIEQVTKTQRRSKTKTKHDH